MKTNYLSALQNVFVRKLKMQNSVFLQKFGSEILKSVKTSPHLSWQNSTWKPLQKDLLPSSPELSTTIFSHVKHQYISLQVGVSYKLLILGREMGYWTKIPTKMAIVTKTMHLWILKGENLNEFFWYLKICKWLWQKAVPNIFLPQIVPFKSWFLPGTNNPTALGNG